jgi:hypothetical protein
MLGLAAVTLSACGGGGTHFANLPRPPSPVNVSVLIDDHSVSVSPSALGGGPVVFIVTNQGSQAQSLTIRRSGRSVAATGPISPQATAQVKINVVRGSYLVGTGARGGNLAQRAAHPGTRPALLLVGRMRPSASNQLMAP